MVDTTINTCRVDKIKSIRPKICNSSLILIHINHTILNDTIHTIDYSCSQGEIHAVSSYRIISK
jgi:hypothetical protein